MHSPRRSKSLSSQDFPLSSSSSQWEKQPHSIQSLDLQPISLHSTIHYYIRVIQLTLKAIQTTACSTRTSRSNSTTSSHHNTLTTTSPSSTSEDEDDDNDNDNDDDQPLLSPFSPRTPKSDTQNHDALAIPTHPNLTLFINELTHHIHQLKQDLHSTHQFIFHSDPSSSTIYHSLLDIKPFESLAGCFLPPIPEPNQLIKRLTTHYQNLNQLLSELSFSQYPTTTLPITLPALNLLTLSDHRRTLSLPSSLTESLTQSSQQITSAFRACKEEAQAVLHEGEVFIREEGEKLKEWVDAETEKLRLALQMGASRLLTYHELPDEWKNNQFIVKGYRFIPLDRWHHLLLSGIQWHNETINIHTHFFGSLSLFYLLFFLWPTTPHTAPDSSTLADRVVSLVFLVGAIKCLIFSTAWHLFSGCGTLGPFRRLACVDYVGISGLIAASVMSMEYYGFYCRPGLAALYMGFTVAMGVIGMILPFQPFFDRPESKGIRITFFVSMACSALIPQAHMSYLYGLNNTFNFYYPALPSVFSYLAGLFFYATNWPERIRPGWVFDTLFHSHQFWHVAIVAAIWLHWRAIGIIHVSGRLGFSCSPRAVEEAHNATPWLDYANALIPHWLL
ncbi:hypothetical protein PCANC_20179 [Puccinia coronata f. sp. avenae]|uniref:HlyIII-domain-containing protein n=1 Tax=Puccinia coronata f. sp. avenae TaxID=200324 RepID=A0A2N5VCT6_9BASI|nr:hypothetical protein PCANC_20179 [Puccinia coronata f. sp. avenae]PLW47800.1 hypothetical protein PCASD_04360 [Puccinia coronata f. sp. avenae]